MDDHQHNSAKPVKQFRIVSIEKSDPPERESGGEWYKYTVEHEYSPFYGLRSGTFQSVKQHLEEYVDKLNSRATYGFSAYAARTVKK